MIGKIAIPAVVTAYGIYIMLGHSEGHPSGRSPECFVQHLSSTLLRLRAAILLADLERIAKKFSVPVTWFFEGYGRKDRPSDKVA